MRTLSRPMFNMGGPIKQGIMHGIREPYKGGGKAALVGNPAFPKTGGREHHYTWIPSAINALRAVGTGLKTGRTFSPALKGLSKWKNIFPSGRFRDYGGKVPLYGKGKQLVPYGATADTSGKLGFWSALRDPTRFGQAIRENPLTAFAAASAVPQTGFLAGKIAKAAPGTLWDATKRFGAAVVPGDQSSWYTPKEPPTGVPLNPNLQKLIAAAGDGKGTKLKALTKTQQKKWADAQRGKRLNNLLDIMGYDRSKKTAIADALIDASKIVSDRGTLDKKNITAELINPIIQATSKRLDKPEQIREAVGLMMAKGEIEKDLYKWKPGTTLKNAQDMADTLKIPVEEAMRRLSKQAANVGEDIMAWQITKKSAPTSTEIEQLVRNYANTNKQEFQKVYTADEIKSAGLEKVDAVDIVSKAVEEGGGDGFYQVDKEVILVTNGVPKKQW